MDLAQLSEFNGSMGWILGHVFKRENLKMPLEVKSVGNKLAQK